jgi:TatD DNase family protein
MARIPISPTLMLYDSHNHLQDDRLDPVREEVMLEVARQPIARMVVNGSRESDWPAVLDLARRHPVVLPSFGVHPWHAKEVSPDWKSGFERHFEHGPAAVGEIGLDRWMDGHDLPRQEEVFLWQWQWAAERNLPVTVHCLNAWGRLETLLRSAKRPERGFLLHSYGGPAAMVSPFAELGAYFSISGYFAHERKACQRDVFKSVPPERLLVETDAPDLWPPDPWNRFPLEDKRTGRPMNHPANLVSVYAFVSELLGCPPDALARQVGQNFSRLFGALHEPAPFGVPPLGGQGSNIEGVENENPAL